MKKQERIQIRVDALLKKAVKRKAAQRGTTITHILIAALKSYLLTP